MASERLRALWDSLRTSLWLLPLVMVLAGALLAPAVLSMDAGSGAEDAVQGWWLNAGGGEDVRNLLSTLLSGVVAMAAMAFSASVVAVTLAAQQYGPRLVRVFRADLTTQAALGTFAGTIVYLVLVLRAVRAEAAPHEVPHIAATVGTALALACVLALLIFIQEVARTAVADDVVRRVGQELDEGIKRLPKAEPQERDGTNGPAEPGGVWPSWKNAGRLTQRQEGYVQAIDYDALLHWAERHDAALRLDLRAGEFLVAGDQRILVHPAQAAAAAERDGLCDRVVVGAQRTPTQDLEFSMRHLVEVAVRALSPGINDPFTAVAVIDRLRGSLIRLTGRQLPDPVLRDGSDRCRILRETTTFAGALDASLNQIRQAGGRHPAVVIHLLAAIARIAEHAATAEQREALLQHAEMTARGGLRETQEPRDRDDIERSLARARRVLRMKGRIGHDAAEPVAAK